MNILFVTHSYPNYVPDLLLHGLRKLIGPTVVDYPRKDCLYDGVLGLGICPDDQRCPGWFPDDCGQVDRDDVPAKLAKGYYDLVISDVRAMSTLTRVVKKVPRRWAVIDGEDKPHPVLPGPYVVFRRETDGTDHSIPLPMALPEEVLNWIVRYDELPKRYTLGFLGSTHDGERRRLIEDLFRHFPDSLFQATVVPSDTNPSPEGRLGRDQYYRLLQQCRVVLSLAGAGYDTFRFWENAACNAIHAAPSVPLCIPNDFVADVQNIRFQTPASLCISIDRLLKDDPQRAEMIREGRFQLVQHHLTTQRAAYFIDCLKRSYT